MSQQALIFDGPMTGHAAAHLITPAMRRRITATYCRIGRTSVTFYIRESAGLLMTWAGGGLKPAWVQQWLDKGGSLDDLAVTIEKDTKQ